MYSPLLHLRTGCLQVSFTDNLRIKIDEVTKDVPNTEAFVDDICNFVKVFEEMISNLRHLFLGVSDIFPFSRFIFFVGIIRRQSATNIETMPSVGPICRGPTFIRHYSVLRRQDCT